MKFYCKKCQNRFDGEYIDLFELKVCPFCNKKDLVLEFIVQGVHPPEPGLGISQWEFEDVLEDGKIEYLKEFFLEEFNLNYSRKGDVFSLLYQSGKEVDLKDIYSKTQEDGKLQRKIYNLYYLLLQGM